MFVINAGIIGFTPSEKWSGVFENEARKVESSNIEFKLKFFPIRKPKGMHVLILRSTLPDDLPDLNLNTEIPVVLLNLYGLHLVSDRNIVEARIRTALETCVDICGIKAVES